MKTKHKRSAPDKSTQPRRRSMLIAFPADAAQRAASDLSALPLAIASEEPYLRGFWDPYYEILDMSPSSVDLARLKSGAALLFNHNRDAHLGLVDNPQIGGDRVLRVDPHYAENALAQEKKQDVAGGTLRWTSLAYIVREQVLETQSKDGPDTYRVTKWEILEASLVTVPADPSVGVGRSAGDGDGEDGCSCPCGPCSVGDCANCDHDPCDCMGCDCPDHIDMGKQVSDLQAKLGTANTAAEVAIAAKATAEAAASQAAEQLRQLQEQHAKEDAERIEQMQRMKDALTCAGNALDLAQQKLRTANVRHEALAMAARDAAKALADNGVENTELAVAAGAVLLAGREIREQASDISRRLLIASLKV